jgi:cytochrome c oxidase subunit II
MSRRWIVAGVVIWATALGSIAAQSRAIAQDRAQDGRRMFMEQGCHGCHTVGRLGTPIGPDLSHVGAKYSETYLKNWLRDPQQQRPAAHMPKLELTEPQIAALAAFLASLN